MEGYNYLAIGNSITRHGYSEYWWSDCGMAATTPDNDYFHIVCEKLKNRGAVEGYPFDFCLWEVQSTDRAETMTLLDPYLNDSLNLITIQLGENVKDLNTYAKDLGELILHIQSMASNAQVVVIGDFWNSKRSAMQRAVAISCNVPFVDLDDIHGNAEFQIGLNAMVTGDDGEKHMVTHGGVALHPNDKGMQIIADRVIQAINRNGTA